ncbi:MAG TPA: alpha/beta hydrolase [Gemmatimonadaceae bacterium]|nr:alpha/beta hydrolase [Gemmatimonadaceae bacterium]
MRHRTTMLALLAIGTAVAPMPCGLRAQPPITFATRDDGVVAADEYGAGRDAVLLVPGGRYERRSWERQARLLADSGLRVLALDLRGRGDSRAGRAGTDSIQLDVLAAIAYLRATGAQRLTVVGASLGGWAAAEAAIAASPPIDGLVLLAHAPIVRPERLRVRTLFLVSRDDVRGGGIRRLPELREQYRRTRARKTFVVLDGAAHAQALFATDQGPTVMAEILRFARAHGDGGRASPRR